MANRDSKLIERVLKDFSLNFKSGDGGGTKVVNELPEVGEEHIIYELQEKKKIPSLIPRANQQMVDDGVFSEFSLFVFVFDTSEDMTNTLTPIIPSERIPLCFNYIIKENKLIMSEYVDADWQFAEVTKVSDYKFDLSNAFGSETEPMYLVILKEYLGKPSEEGGAVKYVGKLFNDELYTFEPNTFGILLGIPADGIMAFNTNLEGSGIPVEVPEEYTFEYIPYEKILKNQLAKMFEGVNILWTFKPNGTGEVTLHSYWIYINETWFNADEIREFETQEKTVRPSISIQQITPDEGYDGLSKVTVDAINLQNKRVSATNYDEYITPDTNYDGLRQVTVNAIRLQEKTVRPTTSEQYVASDVGFTGLRGVTVNAIRLQNKTVSATKSSQKITPDTNYDGLRQVTVNAIRLQEKTVNPPTTYREEVTADEPYDGLRCVTVNVVTSAIDSNIMAKNIKKDIRILDVTGTYDGIDDKHIISTLTTTLPRALGGMSSATVGSNVYLFGGGDHNFKVNTIYKFNTDTETISTLSAILPQELWGMGVATVGSKVYLFGGNSSGSNVNTIYKFDTDTETISTLSATLPQGLSTSDVATVGSKVYLFGSNSSGSNVNTIYKFDTDTETISTLSATLPQGLSAMSVAQIGSNVYLFGGFISGSGLSNAIYKFNVETETITTLTATLPRKIEPMCVSKVGSNVYLFGGISNGNIDTIYKFNVDTETITTLTATVPQNLSAMGVATVGSNVYLFGGKYSSVASSYLSNAIYKFRIDF